MLDTTQPMTPEQKQQAVNRLNALAVEMFTLMQDGMVITFNFKLMPTLVLPNQVPMNKQLVVCRPGACVNITSKINVE